MGALLEFMCKIQAKAIFFYLKKSSALFSDDIQFGHNSCTESPLHFPSHLKHSNNSFNQHSRHHSLVLLSLNILLQRIRFQVSLLADQIGRMKQANSLEREADLVERFSKMSSLPGAPFPIRKYFGCGQTRRTPSNRSAASNR